MRHVLIPLFALTAVAAAPAFGADTYSVDASHSSAMFDGPHTAIGTTTASSLQQWNPE